MPELPEVETIARGLAKRVTGDVIDSVWLGQKKEPLKSPALEIAAVLEHSRIESVRRMVKHIVCDGERAAKNVSPKNGRKPKGNGSKAASDAVHTEADRSVRPPQGIPTHVSAQWVVHLGMTGRLQVCEAQSEIERHTHAILKLA